MRTWLVVASFMFAIQASGQASVDVGRLVVASILPSLTQPQKGTRVTLKLKDVNVLGAIQAIASQAGMQVIRQGNVETTTDRVSFDITDLTVVEALQIVTRNSKMSARITPDGETIAVWRHPRVKQETANGTIVGKVLHAKTKQPIAAATITLNNSSGSVLSGSDGSFRISAETGTHTVNAKALGYVRQRSVATVESGKTISLEFLLEPSASVLDEVIVTGTIVATERKAIPTPITVITANDIEKRGITRIEQLMRGEIPGLVAIDRGIANYWDQEGLMASARIYSRGPSTLTGEGNPIKTYVDGVELVDPTYLGTIDPSSIERIEVITGPQAATIYGSGAMGGVMQIFTKRGAGEARPEIRIRLGYGWLQSNVNSSKAPTHSHSASAMGGTGPAFTYTSNLSYNFSGQWQPGLYSRGWGGSAGMTHTINSVVLNASASMTGRSNGSYTATGLRLCSFGEKNDTCFPTLFNEVGKMTGELDAGVNYMSSKRVQTAGAQTLTLNTDYRATSIWQHHVTIGRSMLTTGLNPEAPTNIRVMDTLFRIKESNTRRTTVSYNTSIYPRLGVLVPTLTLGANGSWAGGNAVGGCLIYKTAPAYVQCSGGEEVTVARPLVVDSWGGFGSLRVGVFDKMFVTLGLRGERNPAYGRDHGIDWTPTNGITFTATLGDVTIKVLGSYGSATRSPSEEYRREILSIDPESDPAIYISQREATMLLPEHSRGPQGGIELYYGNLGSLSINHFQQKVTDLIENIVVDSTQVVYLPWDELEMRYTRQYVNLGMMRQRGWEGTGSVTVGPVAVKATYSWSDSRVTVSRTFTGMYSGIGGSFYYVPTHSGNVTASFARRGSSLTVTTNWIGSMIHRGGRNTDYLLQNYSRMKQYLDRAVPRLTFLSAPAYAKADITAMHQISKSIDATIVVMNATNSYSSDFGPLFPTLGRQVSTGLSVRWH